MSKDAHLFAAENKIRSLTLSLSHLLDLLPKAAISLKCQYLYLRLN